MKTKIEDRKLEEELDRRARIAARKGVNHEEHLPRFGLPIDDQYLKETLTRKLNSNPLFDSKGISLDVKSGIVTIHGRVSDRLQKEFLLECLRHEDGIIDVEDHCSVEQEWGPRRKLDPEVTQEYD
jgi:osmotically-inducible protein OsmY